MALDLDSDKFRSFNHREELLVQRTCSLVTDIKRIYMHKFNKSSAIVSTVNNTIHCIAITMVYIL